jgi:Uma2 family endonuclease
MSDAAEKLMDVDEFLHWAEGREGKWELHDGRVVAKGEPREGRALAMAAEVMRHTRLKFRAAVALDSAVRRAGAPCEAIADGVTIRISSRRAFVPDASVVCPPPSPDDKETSTPLIVVEVLSPATAAFDHGAKLEGYFSLASLAHYLLIDPERRVVILHSRGRESVIETRILRDGEIKLDPPGLAFAFDELFAD